MFLVHPSHCLPFLLPFPLLLPLPFRVFSLRLGAELANVIILQGFQVFGNNKRLFSLSPACTQTTMLLAGRFSLRHRRIESDAERCCGRDRCHSGGFLLRIMPPSWHPVPACAARHAAGGPFLTVAAMALHRFPSLGLKSRIDARKRV